MKHPSELHILSSIEDSEQRYWYKLADTPNVYYCVDGGILTQYAGVSPQDFVTYKDRLGNLWATNPAGHSRLWKEGRSTTLSGFSTPFIYRMLEDREATLWVGTAKEGLYRADPQAIAMVQHPNGSQWNVVEPVLQDRAGSIWFGSRLGLFRLHNGKYENFYHMDLDGIAAYRQITSTDPSARIVLVSDYDDAAMRECARHAGACGYVLKDNLLEVKGLLRTFSAREPQRGRPMENL